VKIARALSVVDGKGAVSWLASHPTSKDGKDCRGKRAACASAAEKSRQCRHEVAGAEDAAGAVAPFVLGLDARSAARSGREEVGMGGGAPLTGGTEPGLSDGRGGGAPFALVPNPISSADRFGLGGSAGLRGGGGGSICLGCCSSSLIDSGWCGKEGCICTEGLFGGGGVVLFCLPAILGEEKVDLSGLLPLLDLVP